MKIELNDIRRIIIKRARLYPNHDDTKYELFVILHAIRELKKSQTAKSSQVEKHCYTEPTSNGGFKPKEVCEQCKAYGYGIKVLEDYISRTKEKEEDYKQNKPDQKDVAEHYRFKAQFMETALLTITANAEFMLKHPEIVSKNEA